MKSHITELTLQEVEAMDRSLLVECLQQLCEFLPGHRKFDSLDSLPLADLRSLVKKTRRGVQARGY